ncbi:PQQ-binding-like beta-propeller repeat protein [Microbulbifer sp. YPW1]|uniref:outer membrane protein assembly factor BamB family protein n=1 Tax=Microbulbifer sp. YPW1 TaxID=2745199 RepID=UPI00159A466B|nr:PQQ-binding-like beta-propeller repeat protein [Microbulbifer sp. YPW1]QKX17192.1 PQQ-binding-like beta-propeller repeat protein [Microbulbifer sp. YPW1]
MKINSKVRLLLGATLFSAFVAGCGSNEPVAVTGPVNSCPGGLNANSGIMWSGHGAGQSGPLSANHYQPNTTITKGNVSNLELAWTYSHPWLLGGRSSLGVTGEAVIVGDTGGNVTVLNKETGCIVWQKTEAAEVASGFTFGPKNIDGSGRAVYYTNANAEIVKRDYVTGNLIWRRKHDNHPFVSSRSSVALHNGTVYLGLSNNEINEAYNTNYACCDSRGIVLALDAWTGDLKWKRYTIDQVPGYEYAGDPAKGPSGANPWGVPFVDAERNSLYVGTGQQYTGPQTNGGNAVIALDLDTGAKKWTFQGIPNDILNLGCTDWVLFGGQQPPNCDPDHINIDNALDFDLNATPTLAKRLDGSDVLIAASKSGDVFGINPDNGQLLWNTRIGVGGTYGGVHWGFAIDDSRDLVYVPVSDKTGPKAERVFDFLAGTGSGELQNSQGATPGMYALDINTGNIVWENSTEFWSARDGKNYKPVISGNPVVIDGVVFAGTLSGYLMAFDADNGSVLWLQDTVFDRMGTNGVQGNGGAIDANWPIVAGNMLFTDSGYRAGAGGQGNMLQAYRLSGAPSEPDTYTVTTGTSGSGSVTGGGTYTAGSNINLSATAASGWSFSNWTGDISSTSNPLPITVNSNLSVTAVFAQDSTGGSSSSSSGGSSSGGGSGTNLALNAAVTVSSQEPCCAPSNITDGDTGTRWLSWFIDNQWAVIDLGSVQTFSQVNLLWEGGNGNGGYAANYNIQVSNDNSNWNTVASVPNGDGGADVVNFASTSARYIRLQLVQRGTIVGFSLLEAEVYN